MTHTLCSDLTPPDDVREETEPSPSDGASVYPLLPVAQLLHTLCRIRPVYDAGVQVAMRMLTPRRADMTRHLDDFARSDPDPHGVAVGALLRACLRRLEQGGPVTPADVERLADGLARAREQEAQRSRRRILGLAGWQWSATTREWQREAQHAEARHAAADDLAAGVAMIVARMRRGGADR